ncbi:MAG: response regulator [Magnetococcus sp. DMHC-1]|nr:response regulator [Magnetococcales bacterium]
MQDPVTVSQVGGEVTSGIILLVDDQPEQIDATKGALANRFALRIATNGETALKIARQGGIDLVLLDVMMPGMSGYETCRRLKADSQTRDIPVIFLTSRDQPDDEAQGLELGAVDYIAKPLHPGLLLSRVRNQLELRRHRFHLESLVQERTRELEITRKDLEFANQAKADFLAVISHEMRTPLNSIIGFSDFLLEADPESPCEGELLHLIRDSGQSLLDNINDIIDFVQMDPRHFSLTHTRFPLVDQIAAMMSALEKEAGRKGLALEFRKGPDIPDFVLGDPRRLTQVLRHLLTNGIKFTQRGGVTLQLTREQSTGLAVDRFRFSIKDTGSGIPPNKREVIFHAFTQAESPMTRKEGGFGLGLAICKKLADLMSGVLDVVRTDESGTEIALSMPLQAVE